MKRARQYHAAAGERISLARQLKAQLVKPVFLPSKADLRPFGIDVWEGDGDIDFEKVAAFGPPKVEFVMIRMGQSWGCEDKKFAQNWAGFRKVGIPRMAYHVVFPAEKAILQVVNVCSIFDRSSEGDLGEGPVWIDSQLKQNQTREQVSISTITMVRGVKEELAKDSGVYTGKWVIDKYMKIQKWFDEVEWWLATWLWPDQKAEHGGPPGKVDAIPWEKVKFHQSASSGDGKAIGSEKTRLDYDRFRGTTEELRNYLGLPVDPVPTKGILTLTWQTIEELRVAIENVK